MEHGKKENIPSSQQTLKNIKHHFMIKKVSELALEKDLFNPIKRIFRGERLKLYF